MLEQERAGPARGASQGRGVARRLDVAVLPDDLPGAGAWRQMIAWARSAPAETHAWRVREVRGILSRLRSPAIAFDELSRLNPKVGEVVESEARPRWLGARSAGEAEQLLLAEPVVHDLGDDVVAVLNGLARLPRDPIDDIRVAQYLAFMRPWLVQRVWFADAFLGAQRRGDASPSRANGLWTLTCAVMLADIDADPIDACLDIDHPFSALDELADHIGGIAMGDMVGAAVSGEAAGFGRAELPPSYTVALHMPQPCHRAEDPDFRACAAMLAAWRVIPGAEARSLQRLCRGDTAALEAFSRARVAEVLAGEMPARDDASPPPLLDLPQWAHDLAIPDERMGAGGAPPLDPLTRLVV